MTNYSYYYDFIHATQSSKPINILQVTGSTRVPVSRHINWYIDAALQQTDGASPVRVPLFYTRNRLAYEGQFFKNLKLSTGIEIKYNTPFKANNYSPLTGQFVPQDTLTIHNLPDITVFLNFRIKTFTAYLRVENLNTVNFTNGFGFTNNNFAAPLYPTPGMMIRLGIQWWFVN